MLVTDPSNGQITTRCGSTPELTKLPEAVDAICQRRPGPCFAYWRQYGGKKMKLDERATTC